MTIRVLVGCLFIIGILQVLPIINRSLFASHYVNLNSPLDSPLICRYPAFDRSCRCPPVTLQLKTGSFQTVPRIQRMRITNIAFSSRPASCTITESYPLFRRSIWSRNCFQRASNWSAFRAIFLVKSTKPVTGPGCLALFSGERRTGNLTERSCHRTPYDLSNWEINYRSPWVVPH